MLVLTRKENESIIISDGNEEIEIVVSEIGCNSIRLGIIASSRFRVVRSELEDSLSRNFDVDKRVAHEKYHCK